MRKNSIKNTRLMVRLKETEHHHTQEIKDPRIHPMTL